RSERLRYRVAKFERPAAIVLDDVIDDFGHGRLLRGEIAAHKALCKADQGHREADQNAAFFRRSLSSFFTILPLALRGSVSVQKITSAGTSKGALFGAAKGGSSSTLAAAPGLRCTTAIGSSPSVWCGRPMPAASIPAG